MRFPGESLERSCGQAELAKLVREAARNRNQLRPYRLRSFKNTDWAEGLAKTSYSLCPMISFLPSHQQPERTLRRDVSLSPGECVGARLIGILRDEAPDCSASRILIELDDQTDKRRVPDDIRSITHGPQLRGERADVQHELVALECQAAGKRGQDTKIAHIGLHVAQREFGGDLIARPC